MKEENIILFSGLDLITILIRIPVLIISMAVHEFAHAFTAYKLGDSTAKRGGRLTLNPLQHIDPIGLVLMLLVGFGWARPVQVNPHSLQDPKKDMALIAAMGPFSNFVLAFVSVLILYPIVLLSTGRLAYAVLTVLSVQASFNISIGLFNLIPIPPLDGSKILAAFLPSRYYYNLLTLERYGFIILVVLLSTGFASGILGPLVIGMVRLFFSLADKIYFFL